VAQLRQEKGTMCFTKGLFKANERKGDSPCGFWASSASSGLCVRERKAKTNEIWINVCQANKRWHSCS